MARTTSNCKISYDGQLQKSRFTLSIEAYNCQIFLLLIRILSVLGGKKFRALKFLNKPLHEECTSGSTGTPFVVVQDGGKRLRAAADSLVFSERAHFGLGTRLYYVRIWNAMNRKSWMASKATNIVMQSSDDLSDEALSKFVGKLEKDNSKKSVLAYASSLIALVNWMDRTKRTTTAKNQSFITMSESMPADYRKRLAELFNCPVISRYSNQECGLIAQQCMHKDE